MSEPDYEAIVQEFIETRDLGPFRAFWEPIFRKSFEIYTCHQGGTDEFMEDFFQRLKTEPFPGTLYFAPRVPCNWLWRVFGDAAKRVKRVTPATEAALAVALENRDAIVAIPLPNEMDADWIGRAYQVAMWFGDTKFIDCHLIAKRLVA